MSSNEQQGRVAGEPPATGEVIATAARSDALQGCVDLMRRVVGALDAMTSEEEGGPCGDRALRLLDNVGLLAPLRAPGAEAALREAAAGAPATRYAEACAAYERINDELSAEVRRGRTPTSERAATLHDARKRMRCFEPHLLLWEVVTPDGPVRVETRNRIDWVDNESNVTAVTGAFAEIALSERRRARFRVNETSFSADSEAFVLRPGEREELHADAVRLLAEQNEWPADFRFVGPKWVDFDGDPGAEGDRSSDAAVGQPAGPPEVAAAALAALEAAASLWGDRRVRVMLALDAAGLLAPLLAAPADLGDDLRRAVARLPAARYASACDELRRASAALRSARRWMRDPTGAEADAIMAAEYEVRHAQPLLLLWRVATPEGVVNVATRDKVSWLDAGSSLATGVCGATAALLPPNDAPARCHEASYEDLLPSERRPSLPADVRERAHREAVRCLADANGWPWAITPAGRRWAR